MLKKLLIISVVLLLLGAGALGLALLNINSLVALYKPELERIASEALGTTVELGELNTSIFPQAKIEARAIKIRANEKSKHSLSVGGMTLELQLRPLFSKELKVDTLRIQSPVVTIVKDAGGIEISGLQKSRHTDLSSSEAVNTSTPKESPQLAVTLNGLSVRDGNINFVDQSEEPNSSFNRLSVKKLSLDSSLDLSGSSINIPKLDLSGVLLDKLDFTSKLLNLNFNTTNGILKVPDGSLKFLDQSFKYSATINSKTFESDLNANFEGFDLAKLASLADVIKLPQDLNPTGGVDGKLVLHLNDAKHYKLDSSLKLDKIGLRSGDRKISELKGDVDATLEQDQISAELDKIALKFDQQPISLQAAIDYRFQEKTGDINLSNVKIFGGSVNSDVKLSLSHEKRFSSNSAASALSIAQAISFIAPSQPARINGTIDQLKAQIDGSLEGSVAKSASGRFNLLISKGALLGVNLAAKVLSQVNSIPLISGALSAYVPAAYQGVLNSPDTPIRKLEGSFTLKNSILNTKDLHIESDIFSIDVDGTITLESNLDLNTTIFFTKEFSEALAKSIPALKKVYASDGRLTFPLAIQGKSPALVIIPNLKKLIDLAGKKALKEGADQLLDQALKKTPGAGEAKKALEGLLGF